MPDDDSRGTLARRSAWLVVAFCCAAGTAQPAPSDPATRPAVETLAAARQRLARTPVGERRRSDRAMLVGLDVALAIGRAEGAQAAALIDVTGYHALPLTGPLPERPGKPVPANDVARWIAARPPVDLAHHTLDQVYVATRDEVRSRFPAVAVWMLPQDLAVMFRPPPFDSGGRWITQEACVVVRLRADRATVIGGNLFEALAAGS